MAKEEIEKRYGGMIGQKFGRLTVLELEIGKIIRFKCQCDCGNISHPQASKVKNGDIKSCGCGRYSNGKAAVIKKKPIGGTLCWKCEHAVPNHTGDGRTKDGKSPKGCEWSIFAKPVPGWEAESDILSGVGNQNNQQSYFVSKCPKFEEG